MGRTSEHYMTEIENGLKLWSAFSSWMEYSSSLFIILHTAKLNLLTCQARVTHERVFATQNVLKNK